MQSLIVQVVYFLFYFAIISTNPLSNEREGKFFGIGLVRFVNSVCTGNDGLMGTCYTRRECVNLGGVRSGACAGNIGVCCVFQATCGGTAINNNTYFVSPTFPNTFSGGSPCTLIIRKCYSNICQIRIDFLTFNLAGPNANGSCVNDAFYVIGGASTVPIICGENSGQHIYVDFNGDSDIQLVINTNSALATLSRSWNLKITQIACDCPTRAPTGCLMYYTALSGTVRSFNYGSTGFQNGTRQLTNENYGVCVEMQPGYCSIQWSQSGGDPYSFSLTNDTFAAIGAMTAGTAAVALNNGNCTTDFIVIPNPIYTNGTSANTDRFCGNGFVAVATSSKPFVLTVVTNGDEIGDVGNRGFSLMYQQLPCTGFALG